MEVGRMGTRATDAVTELDDKAECGEGGSFKKLAVPFLRRT